MAGYIGQSPVFGDFPSQEMTGNGTDTYTLNFKVSSAQGMLVFLNGAVQRPGVDFTVSGTTLRFASVVASGVQIFCYGMGLPKTTLAPNMGSVGFDELETALLATAADLNNPTLATKVVTPDSLNGLPVLWKKDDTGWLYPTLTNGWVNFDNVHQGARYRKYPDGSVEVQGMVKSGTIGLDVAQSAVFTLPVGFRPGKNLVFSSISIDDQAISTRFDVFPSGYLSILGGNNGWVSINCRFFADQ